ncbi:ribosomal protein S18 acetylase RimI-like enzyme [Streptosporangium becharense]|uniref:Ribosomal protein S18 acetylase RimI-like enzyme n=1 Tax=Streptosporangium becharense TaxID=1816182 RepID=A0A7W9IHD4_9ACTN|nr:GNAT family N-acetyltransferase [Streptosporangium becharense]MBB2908819.1 ribosomal protein S18 acetylase RimI-like enzyme [Streptosporangium becharense]MBB5820163.1 ribosomal protein S18 acetylase RimI-like enzyme [Streptosporangium becharense]
MNGIGMRPYDGPADLRRMQELARATWTPSARHHIGGLAWSRFQHVGREPQWPTALWERDGETLAWGWVTSPGTLDLLVHPGHPELADEVLGWFREVATGDELTVTILEGEERLGEALVRHGYRRRTVDSPFLVHMSRDLDGLPEATVPPGFVLRHVRGEEDVPARVAVHRSAFAPSSVVEESYRNVMAAWPYRPELDRVVEAPDGRLAAYCLVWLDEVNGVGELEPVGTHPDFRRMGLARAACLDALHRLREAGAGTAVVSPRGDAGYPVPMRLYGTLGFRVGDRTTDYTRPR